MSAGTIGVGCGAAIVRGGRILLVKRLRPPEAGCWSLPGGRVELLERVESAVAREVREEVGVDVNVGTLLCFTQLVGVDGAHWVAPVYRARLNVGEPRNCEPEKLAAVAWFDLDHPPNPLASAARDAIAALKAEETMTDRLEDLHLRELIKSRSDEKGVPTDIETL